MLLRAPRSNRCTFKTFRATKPIYRTHQCDARVTAGVAMLKLGATMSAACLTCSSTCLVARLHFGVKNRTERRSKQARLWLRQWLPTERLWSPRATLDAADAKRRRACVAFICLTTNAKSFGNCPAQARVVRVVDYLIVIGFFSCFMK